MRYDCDILVSGGGIAGLTAAAAFGSAGFNVICVDPMPPVTDRNAVGADMRSTAMLQPARRVLEAAGVWNALSSDAAPLHVMRIVDAGGEAPEPRAKKDFVAAEISDQPFGWNFPNWLLRRELAARLDALETVDFKPGISAASLFSRTAAATVGLSDGTKVKARLVIAADGRNSPMRNAAEIPVRTQRYGQKALAFSVTHPIPHENVSTEIHRTGGPFTLVPLPDWNGQPSSAVVWMDDGKATQARLDTPVEQFEHEISERSCHLFGPLTLASKRDIWPIISQHATRLTDTRLALIAEAAHVLPPIGAQGLNMSLADISTLLDLSEKHRAAFGEDTMLDAYHRARFADIRLRLTGIDLLNRVSQFSHPTGRDMRALGLDALYAALPVRRMLMQMGLGVQ